MEKHVYNLIIEMCVAVCAGIWAYIVTLLLWLIIDNLCNICYIIIRKGGNNHA